MLTLCMLIRLGKDMENGWVKGLKLHGWIITSEDVPFTEGFCFPKWKILKKIHFFFFFLEDENLYTDMKKGGTVYPF